MTMASKHLWRFLRKAVQLGEEEGLRLLAGDVAVKGYHAKVAVRKRPDFVDKPSVQQIGKEEWALNPTATFKEIINSPGLKPFVDKYSDRTLQLVLRYYLRDQKEKKARQAHRSQIKSPQLSSLITFIP